MQPRIQYVASADGVRIAYTTLGDGPPIVFAATMWDDIESFVASPFNEPSSAELVVNRGYKAVVYDGRGAGASDRDVMDMSQAARLADLEAVVDKLALDRFALLGRIHSSITAVSYAAKHPQRVSHLVLVSAYPRGADYYAGAPVMRAIKALSEMAEDNWEFFTLTLCSWITEFRDTDVAQRAAAAYRRAMEPKDYRRFLAGNESSDVTDLLPQIQVPTLVILDSLSNTFSFPGFTRAVAAAIPGAHQMTVEGNSAYLAAAFDFIRGDESRAGASTPELPSGTAIILFADIVGSTALTERLGDTAFRDKARGLDTRLRAIIRENSGTPIEGKLLGDGVLAVFTSARLAIEAALACGRCGDEAGLPLHLGVHAGDVIREADNVYGGAVNIAARIAAASAAGETLVSETVRSLARTSAGVVFEDRGEQALKGIGETVRVWAVVEG